MARLPPVRVSSVPRTLTLKRQPWPNKRGPVSGTSVSIGNDRSNQSGSVSVCRSGWSIHVSLQIMTIARRTLLLCTIVSRGVETATPQPRGVVDPRPGRERRGDPAQDRACRQRPEHPHPTTAKVNNPYCWAGSKGAQPYDLSGGTSSASQPSTQGPPKRIKAIVAMTISTTASSVAIPRSAIDHC